MQTTVIKKLAHISDLHIGQHPDRINALRDLYKSLHDIDHVVVTGDITHKGLRLEYKEFEILFGPLKDEDRLTVLPGNHDRAGDDVAKFIMKEHRVNVKRLEGVYLIQIDSTEPHNKLLINSHGGLSELVVEEIKIALREAPTDKVVVVALHHHVFPLPEETFLEKLSKLLGFPNTLELELGQHLLEMSLGKADLILHGHRHVKFNKSIWNSDKTLQIFNAGSTTSLRSYTVFAHQDGKLKAVQERKF